MNQDMERILITLFLSSSDDAGWLFIGTLRLRKLEGILEAGGGEGTRFHRWICLQSLVF